MAKVAGDIGGSGADEAESVTNFGLGSTALAARCLVLVQCTRYLLCISSTSGAYKLRPPSPSSDQPRRISMSYSTLPTLGGTPAILLFIVVLAAYVVQSQLTQVCRAFSPYGSLIINLSSAPFDSTFNQTWGTGSPTCYCELTLVTRFSEDILPSHLLSLPLVFPCSYIGHSRFMKSQASYHPLHLLKLHSSPS